MYDRGKKPQKTQNTPPLPSFPWKFSFVYELKICDFALF